MLSEFVIVDQNYAPVAHGILVGDEWVCVTTLTPEIFRAGSREDVIQIALHALEIQCEYLAPEYLHIREISPREAREAHLEVIRREIQRRENTNA